MTHVGPDSASSVLTIGLEGVALSEAERQFLEREAPAGVILFRRNVAERLVAVRELLTRVQASRPAGAPPILLSVDQEGGRVARLRNPFPDQGPAMDLAGGGDDDAALVFIENYAFVTGASLWALGFNVDFAPVLDVLTEPRNDAIGDRAFGRTPLSVSRRGAAFLRGLQASGMRGCLKHFPGQGSANADTHAQAAVIDKPRDALFASDLVPFRELLPEVSLVLVSHCVYPAFDSQPASLSRPLIQGLLRDELGFRGAVVSDDMNMGALPQDDRGWQEALVAAVAAGVDLLLVCRQIERARLALEGLRREARRSAAFSARLAEAAARVAAIRQGLAE
jgi:beta-N-acetylhexosaminidase